MTIQRGGYSVVAAVALAIVAQLLILPTTAPLFADEPSPAKAEAPEEEGRASQAAEILTELTAAEDHKIPDALLSKAQGVAVIPHAVKAAAVVGGSFGKGLVASRTESGTWGAPVFVDLGSVSWGAQLGAEATDLVLVFTEVGGLQSLLEDKLKLGGDVTVAAGPIGRSAEAATNLTLDSAVYSYSRSKGVFAGLALEGAVLTFDDSANQKIYGAEVSGAAILGGDVDPMPPAVQPFREALEKHMPEVPETPIDTAGSE